MHTQFVSRKSLLAFVLCVVTAAGVQGCGQDVVPPIEYAQVGQGAAGNVAASPEIARQTAADMSARTLATSIPEMAAIDAQPAALVAPSMVIRNGSVTIEVAELDRAIERVQQVATALGGYVGNTSQQTGSQNVRSATIELKIPAARYDSARRNLSPIGKIESETSTAEDVGEEFVDVTARQANARRLEERLITLLATRTGKLEDVLAVERELARVREEIERYEGRLRYLKSHVATSTLVVNVHEKMPIVSQYGGQNVIVESFKNAWRIFVSFVSVAIASLGFIIPGVAILLGALYVRRRMKRKQ